LDTVFDKIIRRELPADIIFENERLIVIRDVNPEAPIHLLLIPKKQVSCLQELKKEELTLLAEVGEVVQKLAEEFGISDGYRLVTNNGKKAGQTVFHLHFHLLGGKELGALC
jgi:histidine triad (HIT) family protein